MRDDEAICTECGRDVADCECGDVCPDCGEAWDWCDCEEYDQ